METSSKPEFPLRIVWLESGEVETFEDAEDLICNLEDFDSTDPEAAAEARVTDALGRPVHLLVEIWKDRCEFRLVDTQVEISSLGKGAGMQLGTFSVSLAVKDIQASKAFYEKLGFREFAGNAAQNWLILKNGDCVIGLFQGMFEKNILTFNPGWDGSAQKLASFTDVRELQRQLKAQGVQFDTEADEKTTGPASFVLSDPDGNPILFDQHV